jgi:hypothetical protein
MFPHHMIRTFPFTLCFSNVTTLITHVPTPHPHAPRPPGPPRCEGPVCADPGRPADGFQVARSYEQGSEVEFGCSRPGYILINPRPISCIREPECKVVKPLGLASGAIPDSAINATSER